MVVDLVQIGLAAELRAEVDRRQRLDCDLRRERDVAKHVADVESPRKRDRDRQYLKPEKTVQCQRTRQPLAAGEKQRGLLPARGHDRHDRYVLLERQPDETLAAIEVDPVSLPARAVHLIVAARVNEQRSA